MTTTAEPEVLTPGVISLIPLSIQAMKERRTAIDKFVKECLEVDVHYGTIPGTNKPTLLKPGAELMASFFGLAPKPITEGRELDGDHITLTLRCDLYTYAGTFVGSGRGMCSTKEKKYAWRYSARTCPQCGKDAIIKGREEYGGGWVCFKKKDGCGAKFPDGDATIEGQPAGQVPNPDIADTYNTVQKMGDKRALVAAVLVTLGVSDKFTQDLEEGDHAAGDDAPRQQTPRQQGGGQRPQQQQQRPAQQQPAAGSGRPSPFTGQPAGNGAAKPAPETKAADPNDPRPVYAKEIIEVRDTTWETPPAAQNWAKIVSYFLGRPTKDTIYGDGILATADAEKLGSLLAFMRALKAEDDSANADLGDIMQGNDPKKRQQA